MMSRIHESTVMLLTVTVMGPMVSRIGDKSLSLMSDIF
jgi:hypothetical protein